MEQMKTIEGEWVTSQNVPAMTASVIKPGWMSLKVGKGLMDWMDGTVPFPVAVTTHDGQLFINMAVRFVMPAWAYKSDYQGKECYGVAVVVKVHDGIKLGSLDEDKMRAANDWYPKTMPAWEGNQTSCADLVVRAEAAAHQRVVVILDQSMFDGPFHRIPAGGLDKKRPAP